VTVGIGRLLSPVADATKWIDAHRHEAHRWEPSRTQTLHLMAKEDDDMTIKSKTPGSFKEVILGHNVREQQRRKEATASPPEAQRSPRERVKDAERKRKAGQK
jgi:hypothetical protein